ncbi:porin family protein [Nafulsella turpanensis]|uniref:porin family protein n=1 Tax=Nafulsella turpanensis TaxID=1265690 RepID=UPI00034DE32B|nr:porin family protein [Nafulsella turpanensis]
MKKLVLLIGILAAGFLQAQAQQISGGIKAGLNVSGWDGDVGQVLGDMLGEASILPGTIKQGYHVGGFLSIPMGQHFILEPGLYYSTKGIEASYTYEANNFLKVKATVTDDAHYIDLPLLAKVRLGNGFQLYAGPQLSYLVANKIRGEAGIMGFSYEQEINWDSGFRKLDFGLTGGLGYQFANGVQLSAGYDHGLSSLDAGKSNIDVYNRVAKFSVGYTFR